MIQQEPHMDAQLSNQMQTPMSTQMQNHLASQISSQLPTPRVLEAGNQEENTPAYEPWKGQVRGTQRHEREEAGPTSYDSEDCGSFPSSDASTGGSYSEYI